MEGIGPFGGSEMNLELGTDVKLSSNSLFIGKKKKILNSRSETGTRVSCPL